MASYDFSIPAGPPIQSSQCTSPTSQQPPPRISTPSPVASNKRRRTFFNRKSLPASFPIVTTPTIQTGDQSTVDKLRSELNLFKARSAWYEQDNVEHKQDNIRQQEYYDAEMEDMKADLERAREKFVAYKKEQDDYHEHVVGILRADLERERVKGILLERDVIDRTPKTREESRLEMKILRLRTDNLHAEDKYKAESADVRRELQEVKEKYEELVDLGCCLINSEQCSQLHNGDGDGDTDTPLST